MDNTAHLAWIDWIGLVFIVGAGLSAGLTFTFSTFVMKALAQLKPEHGVRAMQRINVTVINPLTMLVFIGPAPLGLVMVAGVFFAGAHWLYAVAGLLFVVGMFGVTAAGNVPLNDRLAKVEPGTPEADAMWDEYLKKWLPFNHLRTVAGVAAVVAAVLGMVEGVG